MSETTLAQTYLAAWLEYEAKAAHFNSLIRNHAPAHEAGAELDAARLVVEAYKRAIIEHGVMFNAALGGYCVIAIPAIDTVVVKPT